MHPKNEYNSNMNPKSFLLALFILLITSATPADASKSDRLSRIQQRIERRTALKTSKQTVKRSRKAIKKMRITSREIRRTGKANKLGTRRRSANRYSQKKIAPKSLENIELMPNQIFEPTLPLPNIYALSSLLLLGEKSSAVATIELSPDNEPIHIRGITITLDSEMTSLSSMEVIDEFGYVLGTAKLDLNESSDRDIFTLDLSPQKAYFIDKDGSAAIAVRARLKTNENGGVSGEELQVTDISVNALGLWSNNTASIETSGPDFQVHESALARIRSISNSGNSSGVFGIGTNRPITSFDFESKSVNSISADPAITSLTFSVNSPSTIELSNIKLRTYGLNTSVSCNFVRPEIVCDSIPESIGTIDDSKRLILSADISLSGSHPNVYLQISINNPGNPNSSGDITWTDGESSFSWVDLDFPVVEGIDWR